MSEGVLVRRDFVFFLKGLDPNLSVRGTTFLLLVVPDELKSRLIAFETEHKGVGSWFQFNGVVCVAVIRNDLAKSNDAFEVAYDSVSGICDTYSLFRDELPMISPVIGIREGDQNDAEISFVFETAARITWNLPPGAEERWRERSVGLIQKLLPCFDLAVGEIPTTELSEQLQLSLKMYRHGASASAIGIEFLCKMSALEGLVCGRERNRKEQLLKDRIGALIRNGTNWNAEVAALWKLRCEGSHRSAAFSSQFATATAIVDFIFVATVTFVADHLRAIRSVEDLWACASGYQLPREALLRHEGNRGRATRATMTPKIKWAGAGSIIDAHFNDVASQSRD